MYTAIKLKHPKLHYHENALTASTNTTIEALQMYNVLQGCCLRVHYVVRCSCPFVP